ncbi:MAG: DNA polymerase III subunit alpha [Candidatus Paceibacterota bacterium]
MSDFAHLHVHSHYSLLQAVPKVYELVAAAKADGQKALALTDAGNMYGAIQFYQECEKNEIKPILGVDAHIALRARTDKQPGVDKGWHRLVLLVKNQEGYKNLVKLVTDSFLEGFYYKPRIDYELIEKYHKDLVCISPSFSGDIAKALEHGDTQKAKGLIEWYTKIFGDDFYIEISKHPELSGHDEKMDQLVKLARETNTPIVAAHDVYYLKPDDRRARETLLAVQSSGTGGQVGFDEEEDDFSFLSQAEIKKRFADLPDAVENTQKIVDKCNLDLELGGWVFPEFETKSGKPYDEELKDQAYAGIPRRELKQTNEVVDRLEYELKVIADKGYSVYFLIVGDLLREAHERGIHTTIRGSVAGSLTTYLLGITNVDPLAYKLPFERFLNPERPKAPDIDMDFADDRRDEILDYAREKYGIDKVAQIGTFGTMMARGAVRDVARALGFPYSKGDEISKLIPFGAQGFPMTIQKALEQEPDLKRMYTNDTEAKEILDMAQKIEGCARHISVHAAGVVISPKPLTDYTPLQYDPKGGKLITQFDMHEVEDAGLVKFDFLGIRNLAILSNAVHRVKDLYNIDIDIENIPLDDPKTFDLVAKGETIGLFQLNGEQMTQYLMELKPSTIHDINAMVALYRPGPMESIPSYIERKHNPKKVTYLDPRLKDILDQSYGVITYQDDVLMIAIKLGGYSWLEADKLRKAMGKKIPEEMEAQREKLMKGLLANGLDEKKANKLWELIGPFAGYGFNKAHAASYGRVAYQTGYMKANYPAAFMSAVMTAESGDTEKIAAIVAECSRMGLEVLPPDINESYGDFTVVTDKAGGEKIRFGLYTVKNVGEGISDAIIAERKRGGKFETLADFLTRVEDRNLNRKTLDSLIKAGALDKLGERGQMLANIDYLLKYHKEASDQPEGQDSLFGLMSDQASVPRLTLEESEPADFQEQLTWEKELIGLYISGHPLDSFKDKLEKQKASIADIIESGVKKETVILGALIEEKKEIFTKKGDRMAFIKLGDYTGSIEAVAFPSVYEKLRDKLEPDTCVVIKGTITKRDSVTSIAIDKAKRLRTKDKEEEAEESAIPQEVPS